MVILGASAFVRSAIGFGDALIAMGLLTDWVGLQTATPLVALISTLISLSILASQWQQVNIKAVIPLLLSTGIGIPIGLVVLKFAPEAIARALLGVMLVAYGAYGLSGLKLPRMATDRWAGLFGLIAGVLGGAYNTNGPPIVIYGTLRRWDPEQFRLTLQSYFFFANFLILAGHAVSGLWTVQVWSLVVLSLPAVALSIWLGGLVNRRIKPALFEKLVFALLLILGLLSLFQTLR
jgi:uncharacterized membrane protein YfcA